MRRTSIALITTILAATPAPSPAAVAEVQVPSPMPTAELRLGLIFGAARLDAAASLLQHRLRLEMGLIWLPVRAVWLEPSASVRVLGPAHNALWVRAGYQLQHFALDCFDINGDRIIDDAHTVDASLAYRYRSASGHGFLIEAGKEWLWRGRGIA